jgi:hypothetical protein
MIIEFLLIESDYIDFNKYIKLCQALLEEFTKRFSDFRKIKTDMQLFSDPFSFNYLDSPAKYQLELIELQSRESLRTYHREHSLHEFYIELHSFDEFAEIIGLSKKTFMYVGQYILL